LSLPDQLGAVNKLRAKIQGDVIGRLCVLTSSAAGRRRPVRRTNHGADIAALIWDKIEAMGK
jgi:hypothetical protein